MMEGPGGRRWGKGIRDGALGSDSYGFWSYYPVPDVNHGVMEWGGGYLEHTVCLVGVVSVWC